VLVGIAVAVLAAALCLHDGRVGYMPLDQSIVFDGGWRILGGQVPFRDFTTPSGLVPIVLQAAFFRLLGVNWLVYCVHAAVFNGLFAVAVYALLRLFALPPAAAAAYALLSGVVFYPPFGVPFMEQHAFFFSLLFVASLAAAARSEGWAWAAGPAIVLAYLSKQIPTAFVLPAALLAAPRVRGRASLRAAGSLAAVLVLLALVAWTAGVDRRLVAEYFLALPAREAGSRLADVHSAGRAAAVLAEAVTAWGLVTVPLAAALAIALLLRRDGNRRPPALALALLAACALFSAFTNNEEENGIAYAFVALGLVHAAGRGHLPGRWRRLAGAALVALAIADAGRFELRVNRPRRVHGLTQVPPASPLEQAQVPPALRFLRWRLHPFYGYTPDDLSRLASFLAAQPDAFLLIGDTSILYALTGKPSVNPALWFHRRLTLPGRQTAAFRDYEDRLLASLRRARARYVVVEGRETYEGTSLAHFPAVQALVRGDGPRFGPFRVLELAPP
jgi:hypothetical protein